MENLPKVLGGVYSLHWIVTYPVDKVIRSSNNWGQNFTIGHFRVASNLIMKAKLSAKQRIKERVFG